MELGEFTAIHSGNFEHHPDCTTRARYWGKDYDLANLHTREDIFKSSLVHDSSCRSYDYVD